MVVIEGNRFREGTMRPRRPRSPHPGYPKPSSFPPAPRFTSELCFHDTQLTKTSATEIRPAHGGG